MNKCIYMYMYINYSFNHNSLGCGRNTQIAEYCTLVMYRYMCILVLCTRILYIGDVYMYCAHVYEYCTYNVHVYMYMYCVHEYCTYNVHIYMYCVHEYCTYNVHIYMYLLCERLELTEWQSSRLMTPFLSPFSDL